ncbi:MAG TPA: plastocyanin/azurin family copper-binding protein [Solirubrobacteraceae bacterium]
MRRTLRIGSVLLAAALAVVLGGCRVKDDTGNVSNGKQLFVSKCGSCHQLRRAGTKGTTGPNLDYAFLQDRKDGFPSDTIRGFVHAQILHPNRLGVMPAGLAKGEDAYDIASYVALAAAKPGKDTGNLASIGGAVKKTAAKEKNGKIAIPTDPSGQLAYLVSSATATPGKVTLDSVNKSSTPHDIAIKGPGASAVGKVVSGGATSSISVNLKPGKYTFYCSVPGHEQAGMKGTITVK